MNSDQYEHIKHLCKCPGMYVIPGNLAGVVAYISGLESSTGCLIGFREWLIPRFDSGNNLHWVGLFKLLLEQECIEEENAIKRLGELFKEYYEFKKSCGCDNIAFTKIYLRYHAWLLNQSYYSPDYPDYITPYDGVSIPE